MLWNKWINKGYFRLCVVLSRRFLQTVLGESYHEYMIDTRRLHRLFLDEARIAHVAQGNDKFVPIADCELTSKCALRHCFRV